MRNYFFILSRPLGSRMWYGFFFFFWWGGCGGCVFVFLFSFVLQAPGCGMAGGCGGYGGCVIVLFLPTFMLHGCRVWVWGDAEDAGDAGDA